MTQRFPISTICCATFLVAFLKADVADAIDSAPSWPYLSWKWSSDGASCVPTNSGIHNNSYEVSVGHVHTRSSSSVVLYCPINTLFSNETEEFFTIDNKNVYLIMTYKGLRKTGIGGPAYTKAELLSMSKTTGAESVMLSMTSSGSSSVTTQTTLAGYDWNEQSNYYYVRLTLVPSSTLTGYDQTVYAVELHVQ